MGKMSPPSASAYQRGLREAREAAEIEYLNHVLEEVFQCGVERGRFEERFQRNQEKTKEKEVMPTVHERNETQPADSGPLVQGPQ